MTAIRVDGPVFADHDQREVSIVMNAAMARRFCRAIETGSNSYFDLEALITSIRDGIELAETGRIE